MQMAGLCRGEGGEREEGREGRMEGGKEEGGREGGMEGGRNCFWIQYPTNVVKVKRIKTHCTVQLRVS